VIALRWSTSSAILARGVSTRSTLPVLSGILLQANDGRIDLYATDMELSIKASLATSVEREGDVVVRPVCSTTWSAISPTTRLSSEAGDAAVKVSAAAPSSR